MNFVFGSIAVVKLKSRYICSPKSALSLDGNKVHNRQNYRFATRQLSALTISGLETSASINNKIQVAAVFVLGTADYRVVHTTLLHEVAYTPKEHDLAVLRYYPTLQPAYIC